MAIISITNTNIVSNIPTSALFVESISDMYFQISNIGYKYSQIGFPFTNIDITVNPITNENTTLGLIHNQEFNIGFTLQI